MRIFGEIMKRSIFLFFLVFLYTKSFALIGFGLHGGVDLVEIDAISDDLFTVNVGGSNYSYSIRREAMDKPIALGGQFVLDLPVIPVGVELGVGAAYQKYLWSADTKINGSDGIEDLVISFPGGNSREFTYLRMSGDISLKWYFLSLPPIVDIFSLYAGGGCGLHLITPLVSKNLIIEELKDQDKENLKLDMESLTELETVFGGHLLAGFKINPPALPFNFGGDYKYTFTPENSYKDDTNNFGTVKFYFNFYL